MSVEQYAAAMKVANDRLKLQLDAYDSFRKYLQHEDGLINNRMTWMLTIHGFLYGAYAYMVQRKWEAFERIAAAKDALAPDVLTIKVASHQFDYILGLIAVIGFSISLAAFISILAAQFAIRNLVAVYATNRTPDLHREVRSKVERCWIRGLNFVTGKGHNTEKRDIEVVIVGGVPSSTDPTAADGIFETLKLPHIAGGGQISNRLAGVAGSWFVPLILMGSWVVSFIVNLRYAAPFR